MNCLSIKQHSTRKIEEKQKKQDLHDENINNIDSFEDVLISCLNSLHCYLLHDTNTLYRLTRRKQDDKAGLRFLTTSNPLDFVDELDEFVEFIRENTDIKFIRKFINWLISEEYDWDSLLGDIDCYIDEKKGKQ
eukprot:133168_1